MEGTIGDRNVAILVMNNFEQVEMTSPRDAIEKSGARAALVSAAPGAVRGMHHDQPGDEFEVDFTFDELRAEDYDAVVLPGGVMSSDDIRGVEAAQRFVKRMAELDRPIAVICHGAWLLVSCGLVEGRRLTSWPSLRDDIVNAGGRWVDEAVVEDGRLISSRKPDDLPKFNERLLAALARQPNRVAVGSPSIT